MRYACKGATTLLDALACKGMGVLRAGAEERRRLANACAPRTSGADRSDTVIVSKSGWMLRPVEANADG